MLHRKRSSCCVRSYRNYSESSLFYCRPSDLEWSPMGLHCLKLYSLNLTLLFWGALESGAPLSSFLEGMLYKFPNELINIPTMNKIAEHALRMMPYFVHSFLHILMTHNYRTLIFQNGMHCDVKISWC